MKNLLKIAGLFLLILSINLFNSCKKDKATPPSITTSAVTEITYTTATSGGNVTNEGSSSVSSMGICWNTSTGPTIENSKTTQNGALGAFMSNILQLSQNTKYYVRAYATNSAGTSYGNEVTFTTIQIGVPTITTAAITTITQTTAVSGGSITADNGGAVTVRGVCWGTSVNPTTADNKTADGADTGNFVSNLTGLTGNTLYYVRAYATNTAGTQYGNQVSFTTSPLMPAITSTSISSITQTTASGGGNVTTDGGAIVSARGVCWNTASSPTIANNKTADATGTGIFTSTMTGLTANTTYYLRAYATNNVGTAYGSEISFTTLQPIPPVLTTTAVSSILTTTANSGGSVTSDGGESVTVRGVCWSTSANPTIADNKTIDGTGTGSFVSSLTGLTSNTTYNARAYATNNVGTAYGNELVFKTYALSDADNNFYNAVNIGTQTWMAENLKTTHYKDGTAIPQLTDNTQWNNLTTPGYCWYNNDSISYKNTYGALYNWYTVSSGNLCPSGWHIPSDVEWTTLFNFLGGGSVAGGKLKETGINHWESPNTFSTNESGFTALPGGDRGNNGIFGNLTIMTFFWHSIEYASWGGQITFIELQSDANFEPFDKEFGASVRCLKN